MCSAKWKKNEIILAFLFIPVMFFLYGRINVFFEDAWGISNIRLISGAILLASYAVAVLFCRSIYKFMTESAYGFMNQAILIYILALLTMYKYRNTFIVPYGGGIVSVIGAGLLFGFALLVAMKGAEYIIGVVSRIKPDKKDLIFIVCLYVVLNVLLFLYTRYMRHIFIWDNAGYFVTADKLNGIFPSFEYFREVFKSVTETDYNYIILFFASVFRKLFGNSRYVFLLSIVNMYLAPFIIMMYFVSKRLFKAKPLFSVCMIAAFPYMIAAANLGFVDIGGVIFILLATVLFLNSDRHETALIAGMCLAVSVLMRRWYSFYALSFIITAFIYEISRRKCTKSVFTLCGFAFVLLFFFQGFVSGKLLSDYKGMYSAYDLGVKTDYFIFVRYYGILITVLLAVYAVIKQIKARSVVMTNQMFMLLQSVLCFILFTGVQTHGQQHLALYIVPFCMLFMMMTSEKVFEKRSMCILLTAFSFACTGNTFIPRQQPKSIGEIKSHALFSDFSFYPPIDEGTDEILEIAEYLDTEIGENGKTACVLSSSLVFNRDTLMNAEISLSKKKKSDVNREEYLLPIGEVDNRDGVSDNLYNSDYIVVADPIQTHLDADEQKLITVPYSMVLDGIGMGDAYRKTGIEFSLPGNIKIMIYEKIREVTYEEKVEIQTMIYGGD